MGTWLSNIINMVCSREFLLGVIVLGGISSFLENTPSIQRHGVVVQNIVTVISLLFATSVLIVSGSFLALFFVNACIFFSGAENAISAPYNLFDAFVIFIVFLFILNFLRSFIEATCRKRAMNDEIAKYIIGAEDKVYNLDDKEEVIHLFKDNNTKILKIKFKSEEINKTLLLYVYVDGFLSQKVKPVNTLATVTLTSKNGDLRTGGEHILEFYQFVNNDRNKERTFRKMISYIVEDLDINKK